MKRAKITAKGKVQGVSYRLYIKKKANKLGLKGTVRNKSDGSVQIIAEGEEKQIEKLIHEARKGSFLARVDNLDIKYEKPTKDYDDFQVVF
ncbi:MAG: Acylphosphatase [Candidatus Woesearchaeota archaeon]|nr:Acylphosphatase [Candidatus Woesearchaeota archaeon]